MIPVNLKSLPGYSEISDLAPDGHLVHYKQVWSLNFHHELDDTGDLCQELIIELTKDREAYDVPTIKMIIKSPRNMRLFPSWNIVQLSIDDYKVDGWSNGNYHIYDAEQDTDWEIYCMDISFERGRQLPEFKS